MKVLKEYSSLTLAEADQRFLLHKDIPTVLICSDGRKITKWTEYEQNFASMLGGTLYVEDAFLDNALREYKKLERGRIRARFSNTYINPVLLLAISWGISTALTKKIELFAPYIHLPTKYAGVACCVILLSYQTNTLIRKWRKAKTQEEETQSRKDGGSLLIQYFFTVFLFIVTYFFI